VLHHFIVDNRELILARMRERAREAGTKWTDEKLRHGLPLFLTQLAEALDPASSPEVQKAFGALTGSEQIVQSGALHGQDLLRNGFSVAEVVHGYGDICPIVTELASETKAVISAEDFHIFNRCLDNAIAGAVTAYGAERENSLSEQGSERLGSLMHELRNLLQMAALSFEVLKKGQVGIGGSTGALHARSLSSLRALVDRSLAEVRLESGTPSIVPTSMHEFMSETAVGANLLADGYGVPLTITALAADVEVAIDGQLLGSAITNLLQNAFKFTRTGGKVSLVSRATETRALIEVWDECGGLPPGKAEELFRPFTQASSNRSGLGLGLGIAMKAVRANSGELSVRNIAGHGCVFMIDLPRAR
jgi:signal transduction histidine kinase